jgi:LysR family glycine cleavage system transcriptional activator
MRYAYIPTINELHAFCACARTGSATRAAGDLNLTQSAVSRSLGRPAAPFAARPTPS